MLAQSKYVYSPYNDMVMKLRGLPTLKSRGLINPLTNLSNNVGTYIFMQSISQGFQEPSEI